MELKKVISLFRKACEKNMWDEFAELVFYDDGTGYISTTDDETIAFDGISELIEILEKG